MDPARNDFPATRAEALKRLEAFLPDVARYAERRNHVVPGHGNVSRLSPATRTRVLLEREIAAAARERFAPSSVEKFEQEIWWRLYWKGWLEMRPAVWTSYRESLGRLDWSDRVRDVAAGRSGVAIMDHFARELIETGYLHNHARMWWAAFWIHVERLPWQLGADFFFRHLLDGDAASNTLSWRWVAGLHTRGKSYLVRRANVEKYVDEAILDSHRDGLEQLETGECLEIPFEEHPERRPLDPAPLPVDLDGPVGIWIHDDDLMVEESPLSGLAPAAATAFAPVECWKKEGFPARKRKHLSRALRDGADRAGAHFGVPSGFVECDVLEDGLAEWASDAGLRTVVALRPFTGLLADRLDSIRSRLEDENIRLELARRPEDVETGNLATAGFFGFWKKTAGLRSDSVGDSPLLSTVPQVNCD